jgi:hypothetical protein
MTLMNLFFGFSILAIILAVFCIPMILSHKKDLKNRDAIILFNITISFFFWSMTTVCILWLCLITYVIKACFFTKETLVKDSL